MPLSSASTCSSAADWTDGPKKGCVLVIVRIAGKDDCVVFSNFIYQAMFLVNATTPATFKLMLQRFRFAYPIEW